MKIQIYLLVFILPLLHACKTMEVRSVFESESEQLQVEQLSKHTYRHISYLQTDEFAKVACNGMIVVNKGEAIFFDTPTNNSNSKALIDWVEQSLHKKIIGVVVTHFHEDCLGGLSEFQEKEIKSYGYPETIQLAAKAGVTYPTTVLGSYGEISIGSKKVLYEFMGEGHTSDNIIAYFPKEKVLFGGCLIKALGAGKGYLGDANVKEWSNTVERISLKYPNTKIVIPGHGTPGTKALLDYTIQLFDYKQ